MPDEKNVPKYKKIMDDILQEVNGRNLNYDIPLCTEKTLCEKYLVSRITAKRAIDDLENMGVLYRKRGVGSFARRPADNVKHAQKKGDLVYKVVALIIPFDIAKGGIFSAIGNASILLAEKGYYFTIHISEPNPEAEATLLKVLLKQKIYGVVYYPSSSMLPFNLLHQFAKAQIPVITLDKPHNHIQLSSVVCDNYRGGYMLAEHLVNYGHTKTCYITRFSPEERNSIRDRFQGYADCLREKNNPDEPRLVQIPDIAENYYPIYKNTINTLHLDKVTAVICENDEVAFNIYMGCRSLSIKVPEEMNIVGYDNTDWSLIGSAQITTIDQDFAQIGKGIADLILQKKYKPTHLVTPVTLIPRLTTSKINLSPEQNTLA